ncbi:MAG: hypothetical protein ACRBN8_24105 [Nannocystales bacterium]
MTDEQPTENSTPDDEPQSRDRPPCRPAAKLDEQVNGVDTRLHEALGCARFAELHHVLSYSDEAGFRRAATRFVLDLSRDPETIMNVARAMGGARFNSVVALLAHNLELGDIVHASVRSSRRARTEPGPKRSAIRDAIDTALGATKATVVYVLAAPIVPYVGALYSCVERLRGEASPAWRAQALSSLDNVVRFSVHEAARLRRPETST